MHRFTELVEGCVAFTLSNLTEANDRTIDLLQTSGATSLVKTLQMIQLQKVILVVGAFSIFEAHVQDSLGCKEGFNEIKQILNDAGELDKKESFEDIYLAINVLKHGHGRSYDTLVAKANMLPFRIMLPNESFFNEGDVSEVFTLIYVDDMFVEHCCKVMQDISEVIRQTRSSFY